MPASSFSIPSDNGSNHESGVKTFLQNYQQDSTLHMESIQNSTPSTDFSTYDHTGLTRLPVNLLTSCKNADVSSNLNVSLSSPLVNPLGSVCRTSNKMLLILQLKPCLTPVNIAKVSESIISNDNSRPTSNNQVYVKLKENKHDHENKSLQLKTGNPACESLTRSKVDKNKSAVCEADESNNTTRGSFCRVCYVECGSLELLEEHMERNELMICRVCTAEFNSHKELETHFFTHKKYNCKVCQERFSDKKSLLDHRKTSASCNYQEECKACGKNFFSKKYLDKHNLIFHNKSSGLFNCIVCGNGFILLEQLNFHLQNCHNAYEKVECRICHKWYLGPIKLKMHVKAAHLYCKKDTKSDTVCTICEKRFSTVQNLKRHMKIHDVTDCLCDLCGKSVKGKSAMKRHMQNEHSRSGTFVCKTCNEQFDMEAALNRHKRQVHTKRVVPLPVFCEICGKEYKSKAILKVHRFTHFDEKPFKCEICGASFKQQCARNTHRRVHNSEGKFRCNNCEMTFKWKNAYTRHAKKCVGEG
uniref:C2H2-type domain-containing protein n=1 Tax=Homalodisca liturata TaxID=320908 RepID=A0A1B6HBW8_9HEMI